MDYLINYLKSILDRIPYQVIIAVFVVIIITELTKKFFAFIEKKVEAKKGKEIKFFDHTKIIFSLFWSLVLTVSFAIGKIYSWAELPLYFFGVVGAATVLYELFWKKYKEITSN